MTRPSERELRRRELLAYMRERGCMEAKNFRDVSILLDLRNERMVKAAFGFGPWILTRKGRKHLKTLDAKNHS